MLVACAGRGEGASAFRRFARAPTLPRLRGGAETPIDGGLRPSGEASGAGDGEGDGEGEDEAEAEAELEPEEAEPESELEVASRREGEGEVAEGEDEVEVEEFDLVVIGGGSGGLACAQEAAKHGQTVAVCDFVSPSPSGTTWGLGGTCVNVGCIPKKLMHQAALLGGALADAGSYGWNVPPQPRVHSWASLVENVQMHVKALNFGYRAALLSADVEYVNARACFESAHVVRATDREGRVRRLCAKAFVLAVGGRPRYLDEIPGGRDLVLSSDDLFSLRSPPGKTLCIGGGYIALECAGFLAGLGMEAHVLVRSVPLRGFDRQMAEHVVTQMEGEHGVRFIRAARPTRIERVAAGGSDEGDERGGGADAAGARRLRVTWDIDGVEASDEFDTVLVAVGRDAQTVGLRLDLPGVALDARTGKVVADEAERTSAPHVYAIGDVLHGRPELTPVAIQAGKLLARRLCGVSDERMDYDGVPTTVFTPVEYACVGASEEEATRALGEVRRA